MDEPTAIRINNVTIYTEEDVLHNHSLLIENGKIAEITPEHEADNRVKAEVRQLDGEGLNLIPGFIDGHIHGAGGADVMDASAEALDTIALELPQEGTTSFLATTITQSVKNIEKALKNIKNYQSKPGAAEMLGVHLE
ncbi:MAG TPA: amidohydrolase family protein, partial [Virgibacillus sp.]|nr:amidohydrolase family protein [Virgibacillus sp.]